MPITVISAFIRAITLLEMLKAIQYHSFFAQGTGLTRRIHVLPFLGRHWPFGVVLRTTNVAVQLKRQVKVIYLTLIQVYYRHQPFDIHYWA